MAASAALFWLASVSLTGLRLVDLLAAGPVQELVVPDRQQDRHRSPTAPASVSLGPGKQCRQCSSPDAGAAALSLTGSRPFVAKSGRISIASGGGSSYSVSMVNAYRLFLVLDHFRLRDDGDALQERDASGPA
jgi:hypothetical protein